MKKYMIATKANHKLGDLTRPEGDICMIKKETDEHYIGQWVFGYGMVGIEFPKNTTRTLTETEKEHYNGMKVGFVGTLDVG